jgi:hypothetical protein
LSEVAAAGQALRHELEGELQETQQQLAQLTATLTNSNTVSARRGQRRRLWLTDVLTSELALEQAQ